jgi:hypothetical protein
MYWQVWDLNPSESFFTSSKTWQSDRTTRSTIYSFILLREASYMSDANSAGHPDGTRSLLYIHTPSIQYHGPESGCEQRKFQKAAATRFRAPGSLLASWLSLISIMGLMLSQRDPACLFGATVPIVRTSWPMQDIDADDFQQLPQSSDDQEAVCLDDHVLELPVLRMIALITTEAIFWLHIIDVARDLRGAPTLHLSLANSLATTMFLLFLRQDPAVAVLLYLPCALSFNLTACHLSRFITLRRKDQAVGEKRRHNLFVDA